MAIYQRRNVVEMVRAAKCPYWKIYENESKKQAGNFVTSSDFEVADLGINAACDDLTAKLAGLSQGRYIMTAYEKNDGKRKGVDSWIELEALAGSPIAGIGSTAADNKIYIEGIGNITPENVGDAIEKKFALMMAKQKEADERKAMELEIKELKLAARENDNGMNKALLGIGTVAYRALNKSPEFKEVLGIVGDITKAANAEGLSQTAPIGAAEPANHVEGDMMEIGGVQVNQDRMLAALDKLGKNNPDVLLHIERLAQTKENDPDTYQAGLDFLK